MLSPENNALLTQIGPGTPMGQLMRSYWVPALMSSELPKRDGRPLRVRLLGEPLIAFRDSEGKVGLLDELCPHRRASLYFSRNEDSGLRCVYHGWKFDRDGQCVDLPSEVPDSSARRKMRTKSYPCVERGGTVWAYMGEGDPPGLPEFEWTLVPPEQSYITKRLLECNWAQALEGDIDSSHASFLHSKLDPTDNALLEAAPELRYFDLDRHPHYEALDTEAGMMLAARRNAENGSFYWRGAHFIAPYFVMIAPFGDPLFHANIWLPMDDKTTMVWSIDWHPDRPLSNSERAWRDSGLGFHCTSFQAPTPEAGSAWRPKEHALNDYLLDEDLQRNEMFSGIRPLWCQDKAVQESMGSVVDRAGEHLMQSDLAIARWRRRMLGLLKDQPAIADLPGRDPATHRIRPVGAVFAGDAPWATTLMDHSIIRPTSRERIAEPAE